jgi:hypothetical protein
MSQFGRASIILELTPFFISDAFKFDAPLLPEPTPVSDSHSGSDFSNGVIVGGIVGLIALIGLVCLIVWFMQRRRCSFPDDSPTGPEIFHVDDTIVNTSSGTLITYDDSMSIDNYSSQVSELRTVSSIGGRGTLDIGLL